MGKRGPKIKIVEDFVWTPELAYVVGLLTTDGCLINDGRHIDLTSKDIEQLENFNMCLGKNARISKKKSGFSKRIYYRVQISDAGLYRFLLSIGLSPAKTKIMKEIRVPDDYFFDFLRGHHDGDGSFYSYYDPRWKSSFMFYLSFISASADHIIWLQKHIKKLLQIEGSLSLPQSSSVWQLRYAKSDSLKILRKMYFSKNVVCLSRKRLKIEKALGVKLNKKKNQ